MEKKEKLTKYAYLEWQGSLWGACFIAFGLGVLLSSYFGKFAIALILVGIILHSWGMFKIHQRNKGK
jgi:hypothetical protein